MYIARIIDGREESVKNHSEDTAYFAAKNAPNFFKACARLAALLHDAGKNTDEFLTYIKRAQTENKDRRGSVTHSTAGAIMATELSDNSKEERFVAELIRHAIISHHGLYNCLDIEGNATYQMRAQKQHGMETISQEVFQYISEGELRQLFKQSRDELSNLVRKIASFCKVQPGTSGIKDPFGSKWFYLGLLERLLLSLLVDADRTASACFSKNIRPFEKENADNTPWQKLLSVFEDKLAAKQSDSPLNVFRREISDGCMEAAKKEHGIIRLVVPTGAGKTLSSFRFALQYTLRFKKRRIFYIAPFNSILEQNAQEIRNMLDCDDNTLLEHHSNLIPDDNEAYKELTENWASPIVATSAVQFLNALFSHETGAIRRMHALCDAVIIIDEVQAIPMKCTALFNLAMNFLSTFCGSVIVLCSATQPPFESIPENRMIPPKSILPDPQNYIEAFRRTQIIDDTAIEPGGLRARDAALYAIKKFDEVTSLLFIVNTKSCARNIYREIKERIADRTDKPVLIHLSTSMCPAHRASCINTLKILLETNKPVICISTQLIEAGVDISFHTVIRSLAGLQSIIQAAGRCNRHQETACGYVYIIKIHTDEEKLSMLPEISDAQQVMLRVLHDLRTSNQNDDLLSQKAIDLFYGWYFYGKHHIMRYPLPRYDTDMVEMLSNNSKGIHQFSDKNPGCPKPLLAQAFRTAGEEFKVIEENGGRDVLVAYNEESKELILKLNASLKTGELSELLPRLQKYSVSISPGLLNQMKDAFYPAPNGDILILREEYYHPETGVSEIPLAMQALISD